jgi:hypothetical protein
LLCLIFYLFPKIEKISQNVPEEIKIQIYVSEIPITEQKKTSAPPPPAKPYGHIPVPSETAEFPEEISISKIPGHQENGVIATGIVPETPPKPLFEVYPSISGVTCKGYISLLLLVNKNGMTETVQILEYTTLEDTCISLAVEAAKRSRWIPAKVNQEPVDSWITKTYKFNTEK